jgi:hypothetical protein
MTRATTNFQGFKILSSSYNNAYNFLDITIPRKEFTKWLEVNSKILNLTTYSSTWSASIKDCVRIWIHDEGKILSDYDIKEKDIFLLNHKLLEELKLSSSDIFDVFSNKLREITDYSSCSCGLSLEKKTINFSFYTNKANALLLFEIVKPIYYNHYLGIESTEKGRYTIYISNDKEIENLKIDIVKPFKQKKKSSSKKFKLTLEEIAKKFNVDVKDLEIKG